MVTICELRASPQRYRADRGSVQDHLLKFKNGEIKPNHRDDFIYGNSIPIREEDIGAKMDRLIADLSAKAGGGPICQSCKRYTLSLVLMYRYGRTLVWVGLGGRVRSLTSA
jgi:hypothetical protein